MSNPSVWYYRGLDFALGMLIPVLFFGLVYGIAKLYLRKKNRGTTLRQDPLKPPAGPPADEVDPFVGVVSSATDDFIRRHQRRMEELLKMVCGSTTTTTTTTTTEHHDPAPGMVLSDDDFIVLQCTSCYQKNRFMLKEQRGRRCGGCGLPLAIGRKI